MGEEMTAFAEQFDEYISRRGIVLQLHVSEQESEVCQRELNP